MGKAALHCKECYPSAIYPFGSLFHVYFLCDKISGRKDDIFTRIGWNENELNGESKERKENMMKISYISSPVNPCGSDVLASIIIITFSIQIIQDTGPLGAEYIRSVDKAPQKYSLRNTPKTISLPNSHNAIFNAGIHIQP
ncbi:hypothetical protein EYC80_006237 [Monilinia laxa]|uniref:Uncharacterized protein n=1 Tax=Monilinia laxa TaxID=61186 RepID=A0A5N6KGW3_MONLA|nr:hypothetical protein EYC80_006237 [Monilinia laxa]